MYKYYIFIAIATGIFTLPASQIMVHDQFLFSIIALSFIRLPLVTLELFLKLFNVDILHIKHTGCYVNRNVSFHKIEITWTVTL